LEQKTLILIRFIHAKQIVKCQTNSNSKICLAQNKKTHLYGGFFYSMPNKF
jgi:hypothetical protein